MVIGFLDRFEGKQIKPSINIYYRPYLILICFFCKIQTNRIEQIGISPRMPPRPPYTRGHIPGGVDRYMPVPCSIRWGKFTLDWMQQNPS